MKMGTRHDPAAAQRTTIPKKAPPCDLLVAASDRNFADREAVTTLGWNAYDWWIQLGNETANGFYANPIAAGLASPIFETAVRLRDLRDSIAAIVFGNLWTTFGFPGADVIVTLREQITALRADTRLSSRDASRRHPKADLSTGEHHALCQKVTESVAQPTRTRADS
jgi:hypothetical protein